MAQPTYAQYKTLSTSTTGLNSEQVWERILTCLSAFMSGQSPDGTTIIYPHP